MKRSSAVVVVAACVSVVLVAALVWIARWPAPPVRIGVVYSMTGTMAESERPLVDGVRLAVEEINADGGILGRPVEMVVADGRSDWTVFAAETRRLIRDQHVSVVFACWTSACRKAVKPVVERERSLMFYPVQYEGLEQSDNIVYTGAAPNQQIIPGTRWALDHLGKRVYLVGSDYIFPRTANRIIHDVVQIGGGQVVGERYLALGSRDVAGVIADIRALRPDVVLNTINGDSNAAFFKGLKAAGLAAQPIVSFSVAEGEMRDLGGAGLTRHYAVWSYFQSLKTAENRKFVATFRARFGADRVTSDPIEAIYTAAHLWAQAVAEAGDDAPAKVNRTILRQSLTAPSGVVSVDPDTRHVWKTVRVGQVTPDGQFEVVDASENPVRPLPFPTYRSRGDWEAIAATLGTGGTP